MIGCVNPTGHQLAFVRLPPVYKHFAILPSSQAPGTLGTRADLLTQLAAMNTRPAKEGEDVLWGPGIRLEMTPGQDPVSQMMLTLVEEEIAMLVIMRLARECRWQIVDLETGQALEAE